MMDHGSIERLSGKPKIPVEDDFYVEAFRKLHGSREKFIGSGEGRIKWEAVVFYGQYHDLTKQEIEELWYVVGRMDDVYLYRDSDKPADKKLKKSGNTSKAQQPAK